MIKLLSILFLMLGLTAIAQPVPVIPPKVQGMPVSSEYDIRWWNVVANTPADSASAINTAIAAIPVGGTLNIPEGIYSIGSTITINKKMTFRGRGTIRELSNLGAIIQVSGAAATNVILDGLTIYGIQTSNDWPNPYTGNFALNHVGVLVGTNNAHNVSLLNLTIINKPTGIALQSVRDPIISNCRLTNDWIVNSLPLNQQSSAILWSDVTGGIVDGIISRGFGQALLTAFTARHAQFSNWSASDTSDNVFYVGSGRDIYLSNLSVTNCVYGTAFKGRGHNIHFNHCYVDGGFIGVDLTSLSIPGTDTAETDYTTSRGLPASYYFNGYSLGINDFHFRNLSNTAVIVDELTNLGDTIYAHHVLISNGDINSCATGGGSSTHGMILYGDDVVLSNVQMSDWGNNATSFGLVYGQNAVVHGKGLKIENCVFDGLSNVGGAIGIGLFNSIDARIENNTIRNATNAMYINGTEGTHLIHNTTEGATGTGRILFVTNPSTNTVRILNKVNSPTVLSTATLINDFGVYNIGDEGGTNDLLKVDVASGGTLSIGTAAVPYTSLQFPVKWQQNMNADVQYTFANAPPPGNTSAGIDVILKSVDSSVYLGARPSDSSTTTLQDRGILGIESITAALRLYAPFSGQSIEFSGGGSSPGMKFSGGTNLNVNGDTFVYSLTATNATASTMAKFGSDKKLITATNGLDFYIPVASSVIMVQDEFLDGSTTSGAGNFGWLVTANSGQWANLTAIDGHPGVKQLSTLASATSNPLVQSYFGGMIFGTDAYECGWLIRTPSTLSDGTDTYMIFAGFGDPPVSTALSTDAAYIVYRNDINSGKWTGLTSNNSVTNVMSGGSGGTTVVVSTWYFLQTKVNAAGTQVDFYVNGTLIGSSTAQIPTAAARALGTMVQIMKSAGTNPRTVDVDYYYHKINLTNARFTYP